MARAASTEQAGKIPGIHHYGAGLRAEASTLTYMGKGIPISSNVLTLEVKIGSL
jgi:hypothetical protein